MINLKNKKVVVFGMGVSGISAIRLLVELNAEVFAVNQGEITSWAKSDGVLKYISIEACADQNSSKAKEFIKQCELLILSPGIPRDHALLAPLHEKKISIWGEIELGYQVLKEHNELRPIIGITGTNGKTTTTTFLGEVIKDQGFNPFVGGNIGIPFCDMAFDVIKENKKYDYILLELSSFQLESTIEFRPNIAMILNVFQNHGERYSNIADYAHAKFNIVNKMTNEDTIILPSDYPIILDWSKNLKPKVITFDTRKVETEVDLKNFKLPGHHNIVNLKFVETVAGLLNFDKDKLQKSVDQFTGVHHRIEYIKSAYNFIAYNDAKSTNWDATVTAIHAMEKVPGDLYLILGGKKRGHGDSILPYITEMKKHVKRFYLIGEMGPEIYAEINSQVDARLLVKLDDVISELAQDKFSGVLLYSPAFPSFDQYSNYVARGEHFIKCVTNKA